MSAICALTLLTLAGCSSKRHGRVDVDLESCLRDLTNVSQFAATPLGQAGMISSYDRTGGNRDWARFADMGADGRAVVAELKGPGCIRRIWGTGGPDKKWQFYIDGESEPRINLKREQIFGGHFPFVEPLSRRFAAARHCYVPIPFAKSLKIVFEFDKVTSGMTPYCHINYEIFPKGTKVKSFPRNYALDADEKALLAEVCELWRQYEDPLYSDEQELPESVSVELKPGKTATLLNLAEAGTLSEFRIDLLTPPGVSAWKRARVLREVVMRMFWDGATSPSVDVPVGDFFCNALNWRRFYSLPLGSSGNNTLTSRFPMPFSRSARIELRNDGTMPLEARFSYRLDAASPPSGHLNYFHACWKQSVRSGTPFHLMGTKGKGHLVGCYVLAHGMDGGWNILEGDESIRIDNETVPSIHGTGLEDYFNGGWYYCGLFDLPLAGLLEKAAMQTAQYRFHLPDRIPFNKGISFDFEFGDANRARGYMSAATYWYQNEPVSAGSIMPPVAQRFPPPNAVAHAATMAELFELERIGLDREAAERCASFVERYAQSPYVEAMKLREIAYEERLSGYEKVKNKYQAFAESSTDPKVRKQAELLQWFHESPTNALAFANINGAYELYLDGRKILTGDSPLKADAAALNLLPGPHEIAAKVTAKRNMSWCRVALRTSTTNVATDVSWEASLRKPPRWPESTDGIEWGEVDLYSVPPFMAYWQFEPNAYVGVQSGRHSIFPKETWNTGFAAYFRKRFVVPSEGSAAPTREVNTDARQVDMKTLETRRTSGADVK